MPSTPPISAVILAGGKGKRLGAEKAFLALPGRRPLIEEAVNCLAQVAAEVLVVSARLDGYQRLPARLVEDARPGTGALGGLYSGLQAANYDYCLAVACDMPFLSLGLLRYMVGLPRDYDVLVPKLDSYLEPLHAVYSRRCLGAIENRLSAGDLRIVGFFDQVRVRYLARHELEAYDPQLLSLFNINTPEQLDYARHVARGSQARP